MIRPKDGNNQHINMDRKRRKEEKARFPTLRHCKFVIETPKYGTRAGIACYAFLFVCVGIGLWTTVAFPSSMVFLDLITLGILIQAILILVFSLMDKARLVIDEKGIHFFVNDFLHESIKWNEIKRVETGRFDSLTIWKDSKRITFEPTAFSRSDLKRAYKLILSRLAKPGKFRG